MVNVNIETSFTNYKLLFIESVTNNIVTVYAYPNMYKVASATIGGVKYDIDNIYKLNVGYELELRNERTNRKLGKKQMEPVVSEINRIIEEGNDYLNNIINKGLVPKIC